MRALSVCCAHAVPITVGHVTFPCAAMLSPGSLRDLLDTTFPHGMDETLTINIIHVRNTQIIPHLLCPHVLPLCPSFFSRLVLLAISVLAPLGLF